MEWTGRHGEGTTGIPNPAEVVEDAIEAVDTTSIRRNMVTNVVKEDGNCDIVVDNPSTQSQSTIDSSTRSKEDDVHFSLHKQMPAS